MSKVTIDIAKLGKLVREAEQIVFTPEAEKTLIELLEMRAIVDAAYQEAKERIEKAALDLDPNFKSVQGDRVKVAYRTFGNIFTVDPSYVDKLPEGLVKKTERYTPVTKAIQEYIDKHGKPPLGVNFADRKASITIKVMDEGEGDNGDSD